jgi:uncharacterized membrane protein HdeD (DUF308 family)
MRNKFFDLRFVIGLFFLIVGVLLLAYSFTNVHEGHQAINKWCSLSFIAFAVVMIILSFDKKPKDKL